MYTERQQEFAEDYWRQLTSLTGNEIRDLPGSIARSDDDDQTYLSQAPLTGFDQLPHAETFIETYGSTPHTMLRIGETGLLAMVSDRNTFVDEDRQRLVAISVVGVGEASLDLALPSQSPPPVVISRAVVMALHDLPYLPFDADTSISREHAEVLHSGHRLLLRDKNSKHGTRVVKGVNPAYGDAVRPADSLRRTGRGRLYIV